MTTARDITRELRAIWPAPVALSVRTDPDAPGFRQGRQFLVRLPGPTASHIGGEDGLRAYLGRRLATGTGPAPVQIVGSRVVRRRDYGRDREFTVVLGGL